MTAIRTFSLLLLTLVIATTGWAESLSDVPVDVVSTASPCPNDIWLVNTRCLPCPYRQAGLSTDMRFQRLDGKCFVMSTQDEFLQSLPAGATACFLIHGNRMTNSDAQARGLAFYRRINRGDVPFRFVIWSWPSEKIPGPVRDARSKAERADTESYYLASVLATLPAGTDASLIGYSFGARTITGSLHLLGGGVHEGNHLGLSQPSAVRPRVTLLAAALPRVSLLPGGANSLAMTQVEQMVIFYNRRDPALRHFPIVFGPGHPAALGLEGISARPFGDYALTLRQYDVSSTIGRSHSLSKYIESASIMGMVQRFAVQPSAL